VTGFQVSTCSICRQTIRGSFFLCSMGCQAVNPSIVQANGGNNATLLCEDCTRMELHPAEHLQKHQKHCILSHQSISQSANRICSCGQANSAPIQYPFPITEKTSHPNTCLLRRSTDLHTKAKLDNLKSCKALSQPNSETNEDHANTPDSAPLSPSKRKSFFDKITRRNSISTRESSNRERLLKGFTRSVVRPAAKVVGNTIKYGNIHMSLSIGPIVIENGVPK
jgi:hypothetical protein